MNKVHLSRQEDLRPFSAWYPAAGQTQFYISEQPLGHHKQLVMWRQSSENMMAQRNAHSEGEVHVPKPRRQTFICEPLFCGLSESCRLGSFLTKVTEMGTLPIRDDSVLGSCFSKPAIGISDRINGRRLDLLSLSCLVSFFASGFPSGSEGALSIRPWAPPSAHPRAKLWLPWLQRLQHPWVLPSRDFSANGSFTFFRSLCGRSEMEFTTLANVSDQHISGQMEVPKEVVCEDMEGVIACSCALSFCVP